MCTADGAIFDLLNIVPYLKKYRRHPVRAHPRGSDRARVRATSSSLRAQVTGGPLAASDLTKLTFHKNGEGKYHCPVLFKVFNSHSHIVAVKTTGNVYSYEAVKELNMKTKNMKDLLDSTPFTKADLITIQAAGPHHTVYVVCRAACPVPPDLSGSE